MAITAKNDWDRLTNGLATGNVVSGVNTLSGNTGKDVPGVAPNRVTQINFGGNGSSVGPGGANMPGDYGTLHINPDGSYTYTRLQAEIGDVPIGATDVFTYIYRDKNNVPSLATITIEVLPETVAVPDGKGVHKGTAFDDFIDGNTYFKETADGFITIDGADGQDNIVGAVFEANHLIGGAGNDQLLGGFGNDLLEGGAGADRINGSAFGSDTASYASSKSGVTVDLSSNANNTGGDAAGDILSGIDNLIGSAFADALTGDANNNSLDGGKGNDTLSGKEGQDTLFGGAGNDSLSGDGNDDYLIGGAGADKLNGGLGNDTLDGGSENDKLLGGLGADTLTGGAGADALDGGDGKDNLDGGADNDTLTGGAGIDTFAFAVADLGTKDTVTDFKFGEDVLELVNIVDDGNLNNNLEDLLNAGLNASSSGATLSIFMGDQLAITINGWTGPQITSMQDLSLALGSSLEVIHA